MVECFDCDISGEQWSEQRRYVAELKEEWIKEQERFNRHMACLAEAENRLAGSSVQSKPKGESHTSDRREYRDLDPGTLPRNMSLLDWSIWQAKLDK